jgi:threonine/homoserine/homoserine lactone efflux protein
MLWLAFKLSRTQHLGTVDASRLSVGFWQGVALQFLNIKAWMLALTVVAGWLAGRADGAARFVQILPLMLAFGFFSNLTYALIGSLLRDWLSGPAQTGARLRWFNRIMAAVLTATAGWMATF